MIAHLIDGVDLSYLESGPEAVLWYGYRLPYASIV
jgi:hypothetical protein